MASYMNFPIKILSPLILLLFILVVPSSADAAGPWNGKVVDYDTEEPLKGVVVLAEWEKSILAIGDTVDRFVKAYETVTDEKGYFEIPSYINIKIPIFSWGHGPHPI